MASADIVEDFCQHCENCHFCEKVQTSSEEDLQTSSKEDLQTSSEEDLPKKVESKAVSCKHTADHVCEKCIEKVVTTTEKQDSPQRDKNLLFYKKGIILLDSAIIVGSGVGLYFSTKAFFNAANAAFDSIILTILKR